MTRQQKKPSQTQAPAEPITGQQAEFLAWLQGKLGEDYSGAGMSEPEAGEAIEQAKQRLAEKRERGG